MGNVSSQNEFYGQVSSCLESLFHKNNSKRRKKDKTSNSEVKIHKSVFI